jgi:hypothetical protein
VAYSGNRRRLVRADLAIIPIDPLTASTPGYSRSSRQTIGGRHGRPALGDVVVPLDEIRGTSAESAEHGVTVERVYTFAALRDEALRRGDPALAAYIAGMEVAAAQGLGREGGAPARFAPGRAGTSSKPPTSGCASNGCATRSRGVRHVRADLGRQPDYVPRPAERASRTRHRARRIDPDASRVPHDRRDE